MDLVVTTDVLPEDSGCGVLTEAAVSGVLGGGDTLVTRVPGVVTSETWELVLEPDGDRDST